MLVVKLFVKCASILQSAYTKHLLKLDVIVFPAPADSARPNNKLSHFLSDTHIQPQLRRHTERDGHLGAILDVGFPSDDGVLVFSRFAEFGTPLVRGGVQRGEITRNEIPIVQNLGVIVPPNNDGIVCEVFAFVDFGDDVLYGAGRLVGANRRQTV